MRRIRVLGVVLSLMLLLSMFAFIAPAGASTSGGDIDNFGYGILTDNLTMNGAFSGTMGICGTNSITTHGAFIHNGGMLSGGPVTLKGSFTENGNIISAGNIAISGSPIINGNLESKGSIGSDGIVTGVRTPNMASLPVSIPSSLPQPDWDYYSNTCNPTVLSPSNGNISNVISQIHGGTYYINGDVTWDTAISSFNTATTIVANGNITITSGITMGNNGGLALIARKGITVKGANIFNNVLLWAGGYDGASNVTFNGASVFTGDIVSKNGITINGAMTFYQEQTIPVVPPLKPAPPTVTGINPNSGPTAGGTTVTITGTNFTGATAVAFGSVPATSFTVNSDTQITATSPAGFGTVDVRVTTPGGTSATSAADQFTYMDPLSLTAIAPLPNGVENIPYASQAITAYVTASGGARGYSYSVDGLPGDFSFDPGTNIISTGSSGPSYDDLTKMDGGLYALKTYPLTVTVRDSAGHTFSCHLSLTVLPFINRGEVLSKQSKQPLSNKTIYGKTFPIYGYYADTTNERIDSIDVTIGTQSVSINLNQNDVPSEIITQLGGNSNYYKGFDFTLDTTTLTKTFGGPYTITIKETAKKRGEDQWVDQYVTRQFYVYQAYER